MSERGIIATSPIYDDELRQAVFALVKDWQKGSAIVCLSVIAAPGGLHSGCETEDAEQLARDVSDWMKNNGHSDDLADLEIYCIPDSGESVVYFVSSSGVKMRVFSSFVTTVKDWRKSA
jgi:hypothetical protein